LVFYLFFSRWLIIYTCNTLIAQKTYQKNKRTDSTIKGHANKIKTTLLENCTIVMWKSKGLSKNVPELILAETVKRGKGYEELREYIFYCKNQN
jgi:hypothetical protein